MQIDELILAEKLEFLNIAQNTIEQTANKDIVVQTIDLIALCPMFENEYNTDDEYFYPKFKVMFPELYDEICRLKIKQNESTYLWYKDDKKRLYGKKGRLRLINRIRKQLLKRSK